MIANLITNITMFEHVAREDGERDGTADACDGLSKHPRPELKLSLLSTKYRDTYLHSYHGAYNLQMRVNKECEFRDRVSTQRAETLKRNHQQIRENSQDDRSR